MDISIKVSNLGFQVSGIDNYTRRDCVMEKGSHTVIPISRMTERLKVAKEIFGKNINFRRMDLNDTAKVKEFFEEIKPEGFVVLHRIDETDFKKN